MGVLSNIRVLMTLNNKNFSQGLKKSQSEVKEFNLNIGKLGQGIATAFSVAVLIQWGQELAKLNRDIYNSEIAFNRLTDGYLDLNRLREATGGMVSDLKLMQQTVQALNLGLRRSDLATFFKFAAVRAAETGVNVDYLVNSIVTGVGRQSRLVLDNLGISLIALNAEIEKTGNFMEAAVNIINRELRESGREVDDVRTGVQLLSASWSNWVQAVAEGPIGEVFNNTLTLIGTIIDKIRDELGLGITTPVSIVDTTGMELDELRELEKHYQGLVDIQKALLGDEYDRALDANARDLWEVQNAISKIINATEEAEKVTWGYGVSLGSARDILNEMSELSIARRKAQEEWTKEFMKPFGFEDESFIPDIPFDTEKVVAELDKITDSYYELAESMIYVGDIAANILTTAIQAFADALSQGLETGDFLGSFKQFLSQLGRLMVSYGSAMIALGVGQELLEKGPAIAKIAGGAIVLAAGLALSAASGGIKNTASNFGRGGGRGAYSSYGGNYYAPEIDFNREIVMVARGEDLVAVINRQNFRQGVNL